MWKFDLLKLTSQRSDQLTSSETTPWKHSPTFTNIQQKWDNNIHNIHQHSPTIRGFEQNIQPKTIINNHQQSEEWDNNNHQQSPTITNNHEKWDNNNHQQSPTINNHEKWDNNNQQQSSTITKSETTTITNNHQYSGKVRQHHSPTFTNHLKT